MWCYSLRFPRIQKIKLDCDYLDCITFEQVQELGKQSISTERLNRPSETVPEFRKETKKRVRFVFDEKIQSERLVKSEYYLHVSMKINSRSRESICNWLEERGFEVIWSYMALMRYSYRKILLITSSSDVTDYADDRVIKLNDLKDLVEILKWDSNHFWINN